MRPLMTADREGYTSGYNAITCQGQGDVDTGIDFGVYVQAPGEVIREQDVKEAAWLLVRGRANIAYGKQAGSAEELERRSVERTSLFDEPPVAFHVCGETIVEIEASTECEWLISKTTNETRFAPMFFDRSNLTPEFRGLGLVQDACLRNVRLIFDKSIRPESNLVLGEVINLPGRWSSYPPHHHDQAEIYHYRFTEPQGYGHGEVGDDVYKVKHRDTITIPGGVDHAQCSAPGYGMYYYWVIRHQDGNPYLGFEFTEEHKWTLDPKNQGWKPSDFEGVL